jgi:hypothetical protein
MAELVSRVRPRPVFLGLAWTLRKGAQEAVCELWGHASTWELRLVIGRLEFTERCVDSETILNIEERWATILRRRGWT